MKLKFLLSILFLGIAFFLPELAIAENVVTADGAMAAAHALPPMWAVIPFVVLLLMIATGPLFYAHFWHKYYPHVSVALGALVVGFYLLSLHEFAAPIHSFFEYFSFIALLTALFVASGGILIKVDKKGTPLTNLGLLVFGALIANVIGTTGASMLLIRPFMRLNKGRIKSYHVVFFIFMCSNVGGCLTPIGDPPLFLGFLKGIDFFWTVEHIWPYWFVGIGLLGAIFYFMDSRNKETSDQENYTGKIEVIGAKNLIFLAITIAAVFIDPNVMDLPSWAYISYHGDKFSYIREVIMLGTAYAAFKFSDKTALKGNDFNFEPIREVAFLFIGIFATMMPALALIGNFAAHGGQDLITSDSLYWMTGALSGVLDNAPTYMNFLAAGMGKVGLNVSSIEDVKAFQAASSIPGNTESGYLLAISIGAVFFGAFTYIGNAPNFMVKAIAEQNGLTMPSFVAYIFKYSFTILLPVLFVTWLVVKFLF